MSRVVLTALLISAMILAVPSLADTVLLNDGRKFVGTVRVNTSQKVVIDVNSGGIGYQMEFKRAEVAKVIVGGDSATSKPTSNPAGSSASSQPSSDVAPPAAAKVLVIPIHGLFGYDINEEVVAKSLRLAKSSKSAMVILDIDSRGGKVETLIKILQAKAEVKDTRFIAFVSGQARSAAGMLAMSCPEIYMAPNSSIGSTLPEPRRTPRYGEEEDDEEEDLEKQFNADLPAQRRGYVAEAGHDPLFLEGMQDVEIEIGIDKSDRGVKLVRSGGEQTIKRSGKALSMTADEAVEYGLAKGKAKSLKELLETLNVNAKDVNSSYPMSLQKEWEKLLEGRLKKYELAMKTAKDDFNTAVSKFRTADYALSDRLLKKVQPNLTSAESILKTYPCLLEFKKVSYDKKEMDALKKDMDILARWLVLADKENWSKDENRWRRHSWDDRFGWYRD